MSLVLEKRLLDTNEEWATGLLVRATVHFFLGLRTYYVAFPIAMWLVGPWPLLASSFVVLATLAYQDHMIW